MLAFVSQGPAFNSNTHAPHYRTMYGRQQVDSGGDFFRERIRSLTQQRARKAQWLPDEVDDGDDSDYSQLAPHERNYLDAMETQRRMDRIRNEYESRARAMEAEAERQRQAEEQRARELGHRWMGGHHAGALEEMRRQMQQASKNHSAALQREAVSILPCSLTLITQFRIEFACQAHARAARAKLM